MFSIVIPLYNKELSIKNTIDSVLNQTFNDFEIVIVNDGSTDDSLAVVNKFSDPRIRVINQSNGGVSSARNRGVKEAKGPWVSFLDADDLWKKDHLQVLFDLIQMFPDDKVFCTSYMRSNEIESPISDSSVRVIEDYFVETLASPFYWTSVACIHSAIFEDVGYFLIGYSRGEDLELWQRIARKYRFIKSNKITAIYKLDSENKLTKAKYDYKKSTISNVHTRIEFYVSANERRFYLQDMKRSILNYLKQGDLKSAILTFYRLIALSRKNIIKTGK